MRSRDLEDGRKRADGFEREPDADEQLDLLADRVEPIEKHGCECLVDPTTAPTLAGRSRRRSGRIAFSA
ncbi:MAG: hypothetical protein ABW186_11365 [Rhodanobacteraceae bacterium]